MIDTSKAPCRLSPDEAYAIDWLNSREYEGEMVALKKGKTAITVKKGNTEKTLYLCDTNGMMRGSIEETMIRFEQRLIRSL